MRIHDGILWSFWKTRGRGLSVLFCGLSCGVTEDGAEMESEIAVDCSSWRDINSLQAHKRLSKPSPSDSSGHMRKAPGLAANAVGSIRLAGQRYGLIQEIKSS